MASPTVLILYNQPLLPPDHPESASEHTIVDIAEAMTTILQNAGFRIRRLGLEPNPTALWNELRRNRPHVVFNLFEGSIHDTETESYVAGLLQWARIPFTGSPLSTLTLARAKHVTKHLLRGAGLPTADFFFVEQFPVPPCLLEWPVIAKPAQQDASVGMDQESVCTDQEQLEHRVQYLLETYGPVLVEEYIRGREFNVALLELPELEYLAPAEIVFPEEKPGYWPILTYDGKWMPGTPEYDRTPPKFPADITPATARKLGAIALKAYRLLGCRDYARVDLRMKPNGRPYILEVNPNPEISAYAGFAGCLGAAGIPHEQFIVRLINQALSRHGSPSPTFAPTRMSSSELTS
jgi:D-alanine-D-alanine ligase